MKIQKKVIILIFVMIFFICMLFFFSQRYFESKNFHSQPFFSLIVLPDTQKYSEKNGDFFCSQTEWIVKNKEKLNIIFTLHLGDIIQNGVGSDDQWKTASECMKKLDGEIPYGIIPGNHDVDVGDDPLSESSKYNSNFPVNRFNKYHWYRGNYKDNQNSYQIINTAIGDLLFLNLEVDPTDDDLAWADMILKENSMAKVIVNTHAYLNDQTAERFSEPHFRKDGNSGENIWNKLISQNCNVFLVLSGHSHSAEGENKLISINQCGQNVFQLVQNYQSRFLGGNGLLRIFTFYPDIKKIKIQTFSTVFNKYENDENSYFFLDL